MTRAIRVDAKHQAQVLLERLHERFTGRVRASNTCVVKAHITVAQPYIAAYVVLGDGGKPTGVGFAKCSPGDVWDVDTGARIAIARALRDALPEKQGSTRADTLAHAMGRRPK